MKQKTSKPQKRAGAYLIMVFLVFLWGYEYVAAKYALEALSPINLVFIKEKGKLEDAALIQH